MLIKYTYGFSNYEESLILHWMTLVGLICFLKKYIYGMNRENMAKKVESQFNIEKEGNHGWLWNAHLNRSPGSLC